MTHPESQRIRPVGVHRGLVVEYLTIGWNAVEATVAVVSGLIATSVALTAFGIDSGIELVSAVIVAARLRSMMADGVSDEAKEHFVLRLVAICFLRWPSTSSSALLSRSLSKTIRQSAR